MQTKTVVIPTGRFGTKTLSALAEAVFDIPMLIDTIYTKNKPNRYLVAGGTGNGLLPKDLGELLINTLYTRHEQVVFILEFSDYAKAQYINGQWTDL